jgi:Flp pilus assembly protein TadD
VAEGRSERGDAAGALKAFDELARLEPGNAELHSKAAAPTLITSGR